MLHCRLPSVGNVMDFALFAVKDVKEPRTTVGLKAHAVPFFVEHSGCFCVEEEIER